MKELASKKCVPCEGGVTAISADKAAEYLRQISPEWRLVDDGKKLEHKFKFKNFQEALNFVNEVGGLAEAENHHPRITFGWGFANVTLWTHAISGLHENDFILAAKIDQLEPGF